jgi:hypothetical protein
MRGSSIKRRFQKGTEDVWKPGQRCSSIGVADERETS